MFGGSKTSQGVRLDVGDGIVKFQWGKDKQTGQHFFAKGKFRDDIPSPWKWGIPKGN